MKCAVLLSLGLLAGLSPQAVAAPPSAAQARVWSFASTGVGYGALFLAAALDSSPLAVAGAVGGLAGPGAGHLRAGDGRHAALGIGIRGAALGGLLASGLPFTEYCLMKSDQEPERYTWWEGPPCGHSGPEKLLGWGSMGVFLGSSAYDCWDAGRAPARVAQRESALTLGIRPGGLVIAGTF